MGVDFNSSSESQWGLKTGSILLSAAPALI